MGKNVNQVQTPGAAAPASAAVAGPADTAAGALAADAGTADPVASGPELPPDLAALVHDAIAKGIAAGLARFAPAAVPAKPTTVVLRPYDEVVAEVNALPEAERKPTLTDIGWYVPPVVSTPNAQLR